MHRRGRTISMLVSPEGEFRVEFCTDPGFDAAHTVAHTLRRHRAFGVRAATVLSVRWQPD